MITLQKYVRPQTLEEAWQLNQSKRNCILGGMLWLRLGSGSYNTAIDLCDLGLNTIIENDDEFSIGALVTLRDLELHSGLNTYSQNVLKNAVKDIVGVQFRNMATIGGSLWGRFGFSDILTVLLSMDTYVELYKGGIIPLEQFSASKPDNDILVRLIIKKSPLQIEYTSMRNQRTDFPVLTCALSYINHEYRLSVGARPSRARVLRDDNGILIRGINAQSAKDFAAYAAETVPTGSNSRGSAAYRTHLVQVLTERLLRKLGGM